MAAWLVVCYALLLLVHNSAQADGTEVVVKKAGENVTLSCDGVDGDEQLGKVVWQKDARTVATMSATQQVNYLGAHDKKLTLSPNLKLELQSVEPGDSGKYICKLDVMLNASRISKESSYDLTVQSDTPLVNSKPRVSDILPNQVTVSWDASAGSKDDPISAYILRVSHCQPGSNKPIVKELTVSSNAQESHVRELTPETCYTVTVVALTKNRKSIASPPSDNFFTQSEAPTNAPYRFRGTSLSSTEIQLEWEKPERDILNGEIEGYHIKYGLSKLTMKTIAIEDQNKTETVLQGLRPYTMYMVSIQAYNAAGSGPEKAMEIQTKEGVPSRSRLTHISRRRDTSFYVNWEPPKILNGKLVQYQLCWSDGVSNKSRLIKGHLTNPMTAFITDLTPYTGYWVRVAAGTNGGMGEFSDTYPALTELAPPGPPRNLNVSVINKNSVSLSWEKPLLFYKEIDNYMIKYWNHRGNDFQQTIKGKVTQYTLTQLVTDTRYQVKVAAITKAVFNPSDNKVGDFTPTQEFTLGDYEDCIEKTIWDSGIDPNAIQRKREDDGMSGGVIAGIICGILLLLVIIAIAVGYRFYTCRKCYQAAYLYLSVPSNGQSLQPTIAVEEPSEEKHYPDIPVNDFISHVDMMHTDSDIAFAQEFDEINRTSASDKYSCDHSNSTDNRSKNRYINIVAYDHSRVILKTELGRLRQSDYINANYIDGYEKPKAYIATQGPLPQTFTDFWRKVWEQNSTVIVMITNLVEKLRRKCDQYWPNDGAETYGNITVKLITTVPRAHYTVRVFSLRNLKRHSMKGVSERTVYHYHYTEWPDHGVPEYCLPVLSFVQKSAAHNGIDSGPIIVHCSAGVGRTGTYILIDSMIAQIRDKGSINVPGFTQRIRRQRNFLVQTEDQYIFIHSVLVEYLLGGGVTEVKEDNLAEHLALLEKPARGLLLMQSFVETSLLERQFQLVTSCQPSDRDMAAALKPCNQEKNRPGSLLPIDLKRVYLPARPGVEGSDYINASFLQGYKRSLEFIVTQHPTDETMEDFWRMVWDKNSPAIVVLSPFDNLKFKEFWPPKDNSIEVDAGNFRLAMKDVSPESDDQSFSIYEFILDSIQYDYTLITQIICVRDWPTSCTELHRVFDAIEAAHKFVNAVEGGPAIIMDEYGGVQAGKFCALWTLRDQMLSEKCADFYQVAKLYHYKRPGILGTEEDYMFLHRAMAALKKRPKDESSGNASPRNHHTNNSTRRNGTLPRNSTPSNMPNSLSGNLTRSSTHNGNGNSNNGNSNSNNGNNNSVTINVDGFTNANSITPTAADGEEKDETNM